ncbi:MULTISPECIES: hypothetical protein [unclassified Sphingomonas]|uniref:hypothetical protein n=1 Tax=unclassified Sphingomonas TaxID=196159 RepID=UPI000836DC69|nr:MULTISPECIES: hypothetical protein [unclassified Sphingomonas]
MTARSAALAAKDARPLRAAALWIALLVALASSLLSSGPPRTVAVGSAFNPATTVDALRPLRPAPRIVAPEVRPDPDAVVGAGDATFPSIAPALIVPAPDAVDARPSGIVAASISPSHPPRVGSPRAPPLV